MSVQIHLDLVVLLCGFISYSISSPSKHFTSDHPVQLVNLSLLVYKSGATRWWEGRIVFF